MDGRWLEAAIAMMTATVGLALVAVLVSNSSNTVGVINSLTGGYSQILGVAVSPLSGGSSSSGS